MNVNYLQSDKIISSILTVAFIVIAIIIGFLINTHLNFWMVAWWFVAGVVWIMVFTFLAMLFEELVYGME